MTDRGHWTGELVTPLLLFVHKTATNEKQNTPRLFELYRESGRNIKQLLEQS